MNQPLIDAAMDVVNPELVDTLTARLGEAPGAVVSGLRSGVAVVLGTLANKCPDAQARDEIYALIREATKEKLLENAGTFAAGRFGGAGDIIARMRTLLFGLGHASVTQSLAQAVGVKVASARSLLSLAIPLVLGLLSQRVIGERLDPMAVTRLLRSELPLIQGHVPIDLAARTVGDGNAMPVVKRRFPWPAMVGLLALVGLFWSIWHSKQEANQLASRNSVTTVTASPPSGEVAVGRWAALGEFFRRTLPGGAQLEIPRLGVETRLVDFIEDASRPVDHKTWFDFDRLLFDTGRASLKPVSHEQIKNIAAILKAFPNVQVKIGGYTDNAGDAKANLELSFLRAQSVMDALLTEGIEAERLTAEGYGDQHPVADNGFEEGRARNRRVAMRVTRK